MSWGNGIIQFGTTIAIILGTVIAGILFGMFESHQYFSGIVLLVFSVIGLSFSLRIDRVKPAVPDHQIIFNPLPELLNRLSMIRKDRPLFLAVIAESNFWLLGALMQFCILFYGKQLELPEEQISYINF